MSTRTKPPGAIAVNLAKDYVMIGNIANSLGIGSGIDVRQLVTDLASASRTPKAERFDALAKASQARIGALATARANLESFADTLGNLVASGSLSSQPVSSNEAVLLAGASGGAALGGLNAEVEILQLARAQTSYSPLRASAADPVGTGTLTLMVGGTNHAIAITAANGSLAGIADAINASSSGVRASVVTDQGQARLVLKGESGAAMAFALTADSGADAALAAFVAGLTTAQAASDAMLRVDGVAYSRTSNMVADIIPGVVLTLKKAAPGEPVALGSARPADALKQTINDFVTVFNQLHANLKEARGTIGGGGNLRALDRQLNGLVGKALTGHAAINSLSDIGIGTQRDGTLAIDAARLDAAMASDPDAVEALFAPPRDAMRTSATDPGLAFALDEIRDAAVGSGGLLESLSRALQGEAATIARNRERMETREAAFAARLEKQYAGLDARLAALKATQSYLDQQIKLWADAE